MKTGDWTTDVQQIVDEVVLSESEIQNRVEELAQEVSEDYRGEELLIVGILRGAFVFMSDIIRKMNVPLTVDFMMVSSYGNSRTSSGVVRIINDTKENIHERHVLILEDIIDTGLTYHSLKRTLETRDPASLSVCTLLNKPENRQVDVPIDYTGFDIPDRFVVGYGLDYMEYFREIPYIFVPTQDALERMEE